VGQEPAKGKNAQTSLLITNRNATKKELERELSLKKSRGAPFGCSTRRSLGRMGGKVGLTAGLIQNDCNRKRDKRGNKSNYVMGYRGTGVG